MSDRSKRVRRRVSDESNESPEISELSSSDEVDPRKVDALRRAGNSDSSKFKKSSTNGPSSTGVGISRSARDGTSTDDQNKSIKLTMKVAPSKLREVMRANEVEALQDTLGGGRVLEGPRSRRRATQARTGGRQAARPRYQEYGESDIDDIDDGEQAKAKRKAPAKDEDDDDEENDTKNDAMDVDSDGGADGDSDAEMTTLSDSDPGSPLTHKNNAPLKRGSDQIPTSQKPGSTFNTQTSLRGKTGPASVKLNVKQDPKQKLSLTSSHPPVMRSVEDQEVAMAFKQSDSDVEGDNTLPSDDSEREEVTNLQDEDAEGDEELNEEEAAEGEDDEMLDEDDEGEGEENEDDDDDEGGSGNETPASGMATPDPSKLTQRQRGRPGEMLLALDMAPQQRKFFTDEEKAMKKDEHARKRKELTKRKTQEEKTAALNRLLKPQVSKSRGAAPKAETLAAQLQASAAAAEDEESLYEKPDPLFTRWVSNKDGIKLGVPEEWLGKRAGAIFGPPVSSKLASSTVSRTGLVQVIESTSNRKTKT